MDTSLGVLPLQGTDFSDMGADFFGMDPGGGGGGNSGGPHILRRHINGNGGGRNPSSGSQKRKSDFSDSGRASGDSVSLVAFRVCVISILYIFFVACSKSRSVWDFQCN
jgi:hypothetical protein